MAKTKRTEEHQVWLIDKLDAWVNTFDIDEEDEEGNPTNSYPYELAHTIKNYKAGKALTAKEWDNIIFHLSQIFDGCEDSAV